jgi:hypothetical protein
MRLIKCNDLMGGGRDSVVCKRKYRTLPALGLCNIFCTILRHSMHLKYQEIQKQPVENGLAEAEMLFLS